MEQQSQEPLSGNTGEPNRLPEEPTEKSWIQKVKDKILPGVRITLLISLIFYVAMFVVGIWGVHKCPANDNIPFFLIVTGGIGLVSKVTSIVSETILKQHKVYVESSFYTVELVFLLLGSYWVFKIYKPRFSPVPPLDNNYCNKTVYLFAFAYLAAIYALAITIGLCYCCFLVCICFVKRTERNEDPESPTRPIRVSESENNA